MGDLVVDGGLVLSLLVTPILLVWPRAWGRLMVLPAVRRRVENRPGWAVVVALPLALFAGASMSVWMLGGLVHVSPGVNGAPAIVLVWLIFGGSTGYASFRAVVLGARPWRVGGNAEIGPAPWAGGLPNVNVAAVKAVDVDVDLDVVLDRPAVNRFDRRLRGWSRWLIAVGLLWYLFGRVLQAVGLDGGDGTEVPDWWWLITVTLAGLGLGVWLTRRARWWWGARADPDSRVPVPARLDAWGFAVAEPGGEWVRGEVPGVFLAAETVTGPSLWPWAAAGLVSGRVMVIAQQHAQIRNPTGLTFGRTRTACVVQVPGANLPLVVVAGREAVPPALLGRAINLELAAFNRALWAWGPDPRGFHAVLHPLMMSPVLQALPDGASLTFERNRITLSCDEPVSSTRIADFIWIACRLADSVPTHLRKT